MFSYYGGKSAIAMFYPLPLFDTIIEPFAGSAAYSLQYFARQVVLYDLNPVICEVWNWIINSTENDVKSLPELQRG